MDITQEKPQEVIDALTAADDVSGQVQAVSSMPELSSSIGAPDTSIIMGLVIVISCCGLGFFAARSIAYRPLQQLGLSFAIICALIAPALSVVGASEVSVGNNLVFHWPMAITGYLAILLLLPVVILGCRIARPRPILSVTPTTTQIDQQSSEHQFERW